MVESQFYIWDDHPHLAGKRKKIVEIEKQVD